MRFFALALVLASTSALACPNLSGSYSACRSQTGNSDNSSDVVVTQNSNSYTITSTDDNNERSSMTIFTDGRPMVETETDPSSGMVFTTTTTAACAGNSSLEMNGLIDVNGQSIGTMNISVTRQGSAMVQAISFDIMGQTGTDTVICE